MTMTSATTTAWSIWWRFKRVLLTRISVHLLLWFFLLFTLIAFIKIIQLALRLVGNQNTELLPNLIINLCRAFGLLIYILFINYFVRVFVRIFLAFLFALRLDILILGKYQMCLKNPFLLARPFSAIIRTIIIALIAATCQLEILLILFHYADRIEQIANWLPCGLLVFVTLPFYEVF